MEKAKKIPMRQCLGCNEHKPKRELIRLVRTPEGEVVADMTGKKNGRGAYLCPSESCLRRVQRSKSAEKVKALIGVSPQETAVAPNLSVKENLDLICGIHLFSKEKTKEKIAEIKKSLDPVDFSCLFMQRGIEKEGLAFPSDSLKYSCLQNRRNPLKLRV